MKAFDLNGDQLLAVFGALANPHRMRVLATLSGRRAYVSELARELGISRALLQMHLRKLQKAGLVSANLELSSDGKALKFYEATEFILHLTPESFVAAVASLSANTNTDTDKPRVGASTRKDRDDG